MGWYAAAAAVAVQAVSAIEGGNAAKSAADYKAQVAKNNSVIENQNAEYATEAGSEQATVQSLRGATEGGKIKTSQAANNIDVNSGSAVNVQKSQREAGALDTLTVRNNADLKAYGYRVQATNDSAQGILDTAEGSQDQTAGYLKAGGDVLSGASSLGDKWSSPDAKTPNNGVSNDDSTVESSMAGAWGF